MSRDDPAMFHTDLVSEFRHCVETLGMPVSEVVRLAEGAFKHAFLPPGRKLEHVARLRAAAAAHGLA